MGRGRVYPSHLRRVWGGYEIERADRVPLEVSDTGNGLPVISPTLFDEFGTFGMGVIEPMIFLKIPEARKMIRGR